MKVTSNFISKSLIKSLLFPILMYLFIGCSPKIYLDFDFKSLDQSVVLTPIGEGLSAKFGCPPLDNCTTHWLSKQYGLYMVLFHGEEPIRRLYITETDTFNLMDILAEDTMIIKEELLVQLQDGATYEIRNGANEVKYLFSSIFVNDMSGQSRVNLIFEVINGKIKYANAYQTDTFLLEDEFCTDCVANFNKDTKIDFIQFSKSDKPVFYLNFEHGQRKKHPSGYQTVLYKSSDEQFYYGIAKKGWLRHHGVKWEW